MDKEVVFVAFVFILNNLHNLFCFAACETEGFFFSVQRVHKLLDVLIQASLTVNVYLLKQELK